MFCDTHLRKSLVQWSDPGFRICADLKQIRIQYLFSNCGSGSGSRGLMTKNSKNLTKISYFLDQKLQCTDPLAFIKTPKLQEKPLALKREHPALLNTKFGFFFSIFMGHFCPPGSGSSNSNKCGSGSETLERSVQ
jgi:hypothetical protein